jgi:hypothetical protein
MAAIIYDDPQGVERLLRQRFWSDKGQWIEIVEAAVAARSGCTDDFPKSSPGFHAWSNAVARLRQKFCREGWIKQDDDGIETVVHHDLGVKVAIMNSDGGTADRTRSPRNRTIKGAATGKVADLNDQIELFAHSETGPEPSGYPTWYLCIFDDGHNVRAELSRPVEFKSGYFEKFSERIFILSGDDWSKIAVASPASPQVPDLDIPVVRRR